MADSERLANRVPALPSDRDDVHERPMFGGVTFMVGRHMCCGAHGDELIVRLGADDEDPAAQARWHPFVSAIAGGHDLHEVRSCSVQVGRKEGNTKERCVEREEGARIAWAIEEDSTGFARMVSGLCSGFSLAERDGATIVTARSTFRPKNALVRAMLRLIRRKFHHTQQAILRGLQQAVEGDRAACQQGVAALAS